MGREERQEQSKGIQLKPRAGRSWGLPGRALFTHLVPRRDNLLQALQDNSGQTRRSPPQPPRPFEVGLQKQGARELWFKSYLASSKRNHSPYPT